MRLRDWPISTWFYACEGHPYPMKLKNAILQNPKFQLIRGDLNLLTPQRKPGLKKLSSDEERLKRTKELLREVEEMNRTGFGR